MQNGLVDWHTPKLVEIPSYDETPAFATRLRHILSA